MRLSLRLATLKDREKVFAWRNDPWIISLSSSRRGVEWDEHCGWFDRVSNRQDHLLHVIEFEPGCGAGVVRIDREDGATASISIYLLKPFTGRGLGVYALQR